MKIYLDNNIVSGMSRGDLQPTEMEAVRQIEAAAGRGELEIVTSRETWREQDRTRDPAVRSQLEEDRQDVPVVLHDHVMLGSTPRYDNHGNWYGNSPILSEVVDQKLFAALKSAGLKDADARHFMYAVRNGCDRFVTTDPDFLDRVLELEVLGEGILIQRPSKLADELFPPGASAAAM